MHRYLKYVILFSEHQDLSQRLLKNAIDHMRHWDKNSGILMKLGDGIAIENAVKDENGVEKSSTFMPSVYPGEHRIDSLETLIPREQELTTKYEQLIPMIEDEEIKSELELHLGLDREHIFTQEWLLTNAKKIKSLT
jgi:hypothetical protein